MQWSDEPNGGFTKHEKPICPVISKGPFGYRHVNAAVQRRYPDSLLNWTERIIRMRKEVPEVGWGSFTVIPTRNPAILVLRYDWRNNSVLFVHNFDAAPHEIAFAIDGNGDGENSGLLVNLLGTEHNKADVDGTYHLVIEGYGYRWYRLGGLDYLLKRTDIG